MRFEPGQQIVCVRPNAPYKCLNTGIITVFGPKYNEIVTVSGYFSVDRLILAEYSDIDPSVGLTATFREVYFEPLVSDSVLARELESVPEPFTI